MNASIWHCHVEPLWPQAVDELQNLVGWARPPIHPGGTRFALGAVNWSRGFQDVQQIVLVGRPADPVWDDGLTGFLFLETGGSRATRTMLLTAAWDRAKAMGYRRLAACLDHIGCPAHDRGTGCGCPPHDGPCLLITEQPSPRKQHRRHRPRRGFQLTRFLWAQPITGEVTT